MCIGDDNVAILLESYYKNLFTLANQIEIEEVVQYTTRVVTNDMNSMLVGDFTKGEVGIDLKQMAPLKAPGPDEMPLIFCQHYQDSIGGEVTEAILSCLSTSKIFPDLNHFPYTQFLRAFLSRVLNAKRCSFLAFLTQKLVPSKVANAIIFGIDEQCGLKFEAALDAAQNQQVERSGFGGLPMVVEGLQNEQAIRKGAGVD